MMRWIVLLLLVCITASFVDGRQARQANAAPVASSRFSYVDVYLDAKAESLAAWQLEFTAEKGHATVVGIEGGEHPAFAKNPPYYDPAAMGQNRVILAAFSTDNDLPKGKARIARIHLMIEGEPPKYAAKLVVAANSAGKTISGAGLSLSEGARP
jgi:hypothetical protein